MSKVNLRRQTVERRIQMFDRSPIPLYIQVAALLRTRIVEGHLRAGQRIPTLDELEREFCVARVTVRQAIELLEKEGFVRRQQGRGTFVTPTLRERRWLHLTADMDSLASSIDAHVPSFLEVRECDPPPLAREGEPAATYQYLLSVQYRDREPFAVASVYVDRTIYQRCPQDFRTRAALPLLLRLERDRIEHAQLTVTVGSADFGTSERLRIPLNSPTADARFFVRNRQGIVTYVADVVYRGDCVRFDVDLLRNGGNPLTTAEAVGPERASG